MADFKKILSHADTFLQLANMARDQIAERINKELEAQLSDARTLKEDALMEIKHLKEDLSLARKELEDERRWRKEAEAALDRRTEKHSEKEESNR